MTAPPLRPQKAKPMTAYPHQPGLSESAEPPLSCQAGDRIALVHTADPYTRLTPPAPPGPSPATTTAPAISPSPGTTGSTLSMLLRDGDQVRLITPAAAREDPAPPARQARPGRNPAGGSPPPGASPAPLPPQP